VPGALDLCFIADRPLGAVIEHLQACAWPGRAGSLSQAGP
jgi:hypothetical protein